MKKYDPCPELPICPNYTVFGGRLEEFPDHLEKRSKGRPDLSAKIKTWVGSAAFGASHYRPIIEVGSIPFKDDEGKWRICWDDPDEFTRRTFEIHDFVIPNADLYLPPSERYHGYQSWEKAQKWLCYAMLKHFPPHKYYWEDSARLIFSSKDLDEYLENNGMCY